MVSFRGLWLVCVSCVNVKWLRKEVSRRACCMQVRPSEQSKPVCEHTTVIDCFCNCGYMDLFIKFFRRITEAKWSQKLQPQNLKVTKHRKTVAYLVWMWKIRHFIFCTSAPCVYKIVFSLLNLPGSISTQVYIGLGDPSYKLLLCCQVWVISWPQWCENKLYLQD